MISPHLFIILGAVALLVGMAGLAFVRKIPKRGWVGLTLLLISARAWSLIEAGTLLLFTITGTAYALFLIVLMEFQS